MKVVVDSFGTDRIMLGSDWPVCRLAGEYGEVMEIPLVYLRNLKEEEKERIFYKNAIECYQLKTRLSMEKKKFKVLEKQYLVPFILITSCFAFWGFANDITNPMVKAFSKIFLMNTVQGSLVQVAFYGGYFAMAFPAAIFIRRFTYKAGILVGLGLYATGALLFIPASAIGVYAPFLIAYFILTCGLSFLETSANPYILSMGAEESSTQRLNLAQSFNPIGSITGMFIAKTFIQARLDPMDTAAADLS